MESVADGSAIRGLLRDGIPGIPGGGAGVPSVLHHIQYGGGLSGSTLVIGDGIEIRTGVDSRADT